MKTNFIRIAAILCAALLMCTAFTSCGKNNDEKPTAQQSETIDKAESEGETTTSSFNGKKNTKSNAQSSPAANNSSSSNGSGSSNQSNSMPSSTVQSELDEAISFAQSGMTDDAREMLGYINRDELTDEQKDQYDEAQAMIAVSDHESAVFTANDAIRLVEEKYGVALQGASDGLQAETDANGEVYYRMQIEVPAENAKKIIEVFSSGTINEISSEPLAFG